MTPEPGVYSDIPEPEYHGDRGSLSVSGAKLLVPPAVPAMFKHYLDHGRPEKRAYDVGHVAHKLVLGVGSQVVQIEADDFRTKAAREERDAAYAAGHVPVLAHEYAEAEAMAAAVMAHPIAAALFSNGKPEQSLYRVDPSTGVKLRSRLDWLPAPTKRRMIIPDLKTSVNAETSAFGKAAASYGYALQASWYCDMVHELRIAQRPVFVFVVIEKSAPYLVNVIQLDNEAMEIGRRLNRRAIDTYARCVETNNWPGYGDGVNLASLPVWHRMAIEEMESAA